MFGGTHDAMLMLTAGMQRVRICGVGSANATAAATLTIDCARHSACSRQQPIACTAQSADALALCVQVKDGPASVLCDAGNFLLLNGWFAAAHTSVTTRRRACLLATLVCGSSS